MVQYVLTFISKASSSDIPKASQCSVRVAAVVALTWPATRSNACSYKVQETAWTRFIASLGPTLTAFRTRLISNMRASSGSSSANMRAERKSNLSTALLQSSSSCRPPSLLSARRRATRWWAEPMTMESRHKTARARCNSGKSPTSCDWFSTRHCRTTSYNVQRPLSSKSSAPFWPGAKSNRLLDDSMLSLNSSTEVDASSSLSANS
mmetsp:Transcript_57659/g.137146  ORF Transcript_57659/g.137146 Transcript_57659/m.137146 type:complete len:207 (-) Transcript_57659:684-1304(-)